MKKSGMPPLLALSDSTPGLPPLWILAPFLLQLLAIAMLPFLALHWWEKHYAKVSLLLAGITVVYYLTVRGDYKHPLSALHEYIGFIVLTASLFVVAGGIHLKCRRATTPLHNTLFLVVGALLANIIGTTGASMLLIRPWIRMNKERFAGYHTVFFIFLVSNIGGCLTPIGDPPLFLGFLKGVPFFWTLQHLWQPWALLVVLLAVIFYLLDRRGFKHNTLSDRGKESLVEGVEGVGGGWEVGGWVNLPPLAAILGSVFLPSPWREGVMLTAAVFSWKATPARIHEENGFTFAPVKEVAWLFLGIFATMMPALEYLEHHAQEFARMIGMGAVHFYYFTGILSSLLDNAPTYLSFLSVEMGLRGGSVDHPADILRVALQAPQNLIAISLGAVFFGAMTYIGNGPNFMVKSIIAATGKETPGFVDYLLRYSLPLLLPLLVLVGWLFVR